MNAFTPSATFAHSPRIIRSATVEPCHTSVGQMRVLLDGQITTNALTLIESRVAPGRSEFSHKHLREDRIMLVSRGRFDIDVGDACFELGPGEFAVADRGVAHAFSCVDEEPGTLHIWSVGAGWEEMLRAEDRLLAEGAPHDMRHQKLGEIAQRLGITSSVLSTEKRISRQNAENGSREPVRDGHNCVSLAVLSEGAHLEEIETACLCGPPVLSVQHEDVAFLIVEGRHEFCIGDARALVEPNDALWVPRDVPYSWRAMCVTPARMIRLRIPTVKKQRVELAGVGHTPVPLFSGSQPPANHAHFRRGRQSSFRPAS